MNYTEQEVSAGLVMHLCPKTMLGKGGKVTCAPEYIVSDHHFFLVIEAGPKRCRLMPLYSAPGPGRVEISADGRIGHPLWTGGQFHYHTEQVWDVSKPVVVMAAKVALDQSQPGARNRLDTSRLPAI